MTEIGLRELRQSASDYVRRAEAGEEIVVTVAGRPTARLMAFNTRRWRFGRELADVFATPVDPTWPLQRANDADLFAEDLRDPWAASGR